MTMKNYNDEKVVIVHKNITLKFLLNWGK